jgi:Tol biopolymer transport system component
LQGILRGEKSQNESSLRLVIERPQGCLCKITVVPFGMNGITGAAKVRAQVERILSYPAFTSANRLCGFLRFVVEEELAGRGADIKEYLIGVDVYRKSEAYDPRTDPTVRVDAGKLRARLTEYYETTGLNDPIVISIPKGTYVPCFESRVPTLPAVPPASAPPSRGIRTVLVMAGALVLLVACAAWGGKVLLGGFSLPGPATRIVALTSYPGEQSNPSLSPDGSMVAFSWNGEAQDNFDIYVKVVDAPNALRLTTNPAPDTTPAWSPDGRQIAFLRNSGPSGEVYVISALGGPERRIASSNAGESVGWMPDSRSLLVSDRKSPGDPYAGFVVSLENGERRQITFPPPGSIAGDYDFVVSPDGRTIAFCRMVRAPVAEVWLMPLAGGRAEKLTESRRFLRGISWTPDSQRIVFSSQQTGFSALWTVKAEPGAVPSLLPGLETEAVRPSIAMRPGSLDRMAYGRRQQGYVLWRASLSGDKMSEPQSINPSQRTDWFPQISPNGDWITFASDRVGSGDVWVCHPDGTSLRNVTTGRVVAGAPKWSPDGTMIAFDGRGDDNNFDIYTTLAAGGPIRRLTWDQSEEVRPSWSANGQWIYFTSDRTGRREIWRMPSAGGAAVQMTSSGGFESSESPDGSTLYFLQSFRSGTLWRMPSTGGTASPVMDGVHERRWAVT